MTNEHLHALNIPNKQTNNSSGALVFRTLNFWAKFSRSLKFDSNRKNVGWKSCWSRFRGLEPTFQFDGSHWSPSLHCCWFLGAFRRKTRWCEFHPWIARRGETNPEKTPHIPKHIGRVEQSTKSKKNPQQQKRMMTVFYSPGGLVGWLVVNL